jgi:hypothetical protein
LKHRTTEAPELSMTFRTVCGWIIEFFADHNFSSTVLYSLIAMHGLRDGRGKHPFSYVDIED